MNKLQLLQKIENAKTPDFGIILSKSFELFKKTWMDGFLHLLLATAVIIPLVLLVYIPFVPIFIEIVQNGGADNFQPNLDYSITSIIVYVLMVFVVIVLTQVISIGITAHYFKFCRIKDLGSEEIDNGYFYYLKGGGFWKLIKLSLATIGIAVLAAMLCYLPIFYVMVPLQLMVVVFAFNEKLTVSDIISISFKLGNKFWLLVFGLIIVASMIAQLGFFLCFIGIFFTAYFIHIPIYYFYKETIGFEEVSVNESDGFSTHYIN